jgi:uncharacterized protein
MRTLLALLALLVLPATSAAQVPAGARHHEATITAPDGTELAADVFLPAGLPEGARVPVLLAAGPYFGRFEQRAPAPRAPNVYLRQRLFERGYGIVDLSLRGYGGSEGCLSFYGEDDRRDLAAAVDWVRAQPWSTGRLAVAGFSYEGGAALNALAAAGDRIDAAVLLSPVAAPYESIWSQGVHQLHPIPFASSFGPGLAAVDAMGPAAGGSAGREVANATSADPACWARHTEGVEQPDRSHPFWREREPARAAARARVPVLTSYGFEDTTSMVVPYLETLGARVRGWLGQWGHAAANDQTVFPADNYIGRAGFQEELDAFLDHHLKGRGPAPRDGFVVQEGAGGFRSEQAWPPHDARPATLPVLPGLFRDAPGNTADARDVPAGPAPAGAPSLRQGEGSWTFSAPLEDELHLAGQPVVTVRATAPGAQVVALLYDLAPDHRATIITRGAAVLDADGETSLPLMAQDWRLEPGHRLGLLLSGADESTFYPGRTLQEVRVAGGALSVPALRRARVDDLDGGTNHFIGQRRPFAVDPALVTSRTSTLQR